MNKPASNILSVFYTATFFIYFNLNFFDRSVANIFLIITLLLCLLDYKNLYLTLKLNTSLVRIIVFFSIYISLLGIYHGSPISELDNYYRFLLLLPILLISLSEPRMIMLLSTSAFLGLLHAIFNDALYGIDQYPINVYRYPGTSNTAITYSHMCATMLMISTYYIFYKNNKSFFLKLSALIFLILFLLTETRGPIIGIIVALCYLAYSIKFNSLNKANFKLPLITIFIFLLVIFTTPNPIGEGLKSAKSINFSDPVSIENLSLRMRTIYYNFGVEKIRDNYYLGIGPQNVENMMSEYITRLDIENIDSADHVQNEFLDMILKFGIASIILLLLLYLYITNIKNLDNRVLMNICLIMLVCSQLTQSQFAHHQSITFFIVLLYLLREKVCSSNR